MSEFIRVLGDDPHYTGRKAYMYIDSRMICKIYPIHVVKSDKGEYWRCTEDHPGATIYSYTLVDVNGSQYSCGAEKELQKLGIVENKPKFNIGFVGQEGGDRLVVDPIATNDA